MIKDKDLLLLIVGMVLVLLGFIGMVLSIKTMLESQTDDMRNECIKICAPHEAHLWEWKSQCICKINDVGEVK